MTLVTYHELDLCFQVGYFFYNPADSGAVQLKQDNLDMTLGKDGITQKSTK